MKENEIHKAQRLTAGNNEKLAVKLVTHNEWMNYQCSVDRNFSIFIIRKSSSRCCLHTLLNKRCQHSLRTRF